MVPHIVIIGGGFAGLSCAKGLARSKASITLIDRSNHHLFQPLLYQVATATLSPAHIATPIRSILRHQENTEVLMAEVSGIDLAAKNVKLESSVVPYDTLVIATGARHGYFGNEAWEKNAPGLKSIPDATLIRQKILLAFEAAEMERNGQKREELMHFVLVGGGPTGVEMAGAIAELAHRALRADFRRINPRTARITLVEAGPRLLASFPASLSRQALRDLNHLGVQVLLDSRVENVTDDGVWIGGGCLRARTVIWTAGVVASSAGQWLGAETDRAGRVKVEPDLTLKGHPEVFVLGDTAALNDEKGQPLPGVAPVAMQQGRYVAEVLRARMSGKPAPKPFRYVDKGNLATIGRRKAVADLGFTTLSGMIAWWAWLFVHIYYLIGFRNRMAVLFEWAWAYIFFQRGARLILNRVASAFW